MVLSMFLAIKINRNCIYTIAVLKNLKENVVFEPTFDSVVVELGFFHFTSFLSNLLDVILNV